MGQTSHFKEIDTSSLQLDFKMFQYIIVFKDSQSKGNLVRHENIKQEREGERKRKKREGGREGRKDIESFIGSTHSSTTEEKEK